ncbi:MAG TPA: class I SAM-dependent methyltransferase [Vicinamibacterales bacterium]|jgi:SAM-dependent methyltransferase|nr:class I SAM-dependent methyltransferase [Vicinamibacterales bacterium]
MGLRMLFEMDDVDRWQEQHPNVAIVLAGRPEAESDSRAVEADCRRSGTCCPRDNRGMSDSRDALRGTFNTAAATYEAARPSYPSELFDDLVEIAGLQHGDRLLEIGCATGKATRPLLERGFAIVCVELGEQLAAQARDNLAGLPVEISVAPFEAWKGQPGSFDLVYAANSWHWLDPVIRYRKAHQLLRPNGHLAFWGASHAFPSDFDPFFTEIQQVYDALGENFAGEWPPPAPEQVPDAREQIEASGLFDHVTVRRYVWAKTYSAEEYIALLNTFSGHISMDESKRSRLYQEIRERISRRDVQQVRRHWQATLQVAHRAA